MALLTRFERARILGARSLQLSMGAPPLVPASGLDPLAVAQAEFASGLVPVTVQRLPHA